MVICILGTLALVVGANATYAALHPTYWTESIPVMNATYHEIVMTEYRDASNVSYAGLLAFLANDTTEMTNYSFPNYTCGDFALRLHDNAELHGIESGIVAITLNTTDYQGDDALNETLNDTGNASKDRGHAFDVFNTTDRGLVYVDATGITGAEKKLGMQPDKMAVYFKEGMPLGEIALNQSESFDYSYYQQRSDEYFLYFQNVTRLLDEIDAYNREVKALNSTRNSTMIAKKIGLTSEKKALGQREEADWIITKPFGIVDKIAVYW